MTAAKNRASETGPDEETPLQEPVELASFSGAARSNTRADSSVQNRRQIFRIADPDFANMRVVVQGMKGPAECTCLDISAVGLGILVPLEDFQTADPGMILEYEISFGPLSPVRGLAIVANRAETALSDNRGPLLRLGLRFSDAEHSRSENVVAKKRRSERYFLSEALRPLCVCNDPLWFGELLTISILDFSLHGMSGTVSAKKTVFAEGLRTVFQLAFPYVGIVEVPVRVIYANPTDDPKIFRIGCEFVRRSDDFNAAAEMYLKLFSFEGNSLNKKAPPFESLFAPPALLLSDKKELEAAGSQFLELLSDMEVSRHVQIFPLYGKLFNKSLNDAIFFRFELHIEHESDQKGGEEEEPLLGRQYVVITLDEFKSFSLSELRRMMSFILYFCIVKKVHSLKTYVNHEADAPGLFAQLEKIGFMVPDLGKSLREREFTISDVKSCTSVTRSLWFRSVLPLARFENVFAKKDSRGDTFGRIAFELIGFALKFAKSFFSPLANDKDSKTY